MEGEEFGGTVGEERHGDFGGDCGNGKGILVMQPSRRAFLMGRPTPRTPWQHFCERLRALCDGTLVPLASPASPAPAAPLASGGASATAGHVGSDSGGQALASGASAVPQARWTPLGNADVRQARALCAEHGVLLALWGAPGTPGTSGTPGSPGISGTSGTSGTSVTPGIPRTPGVPAGRPILWIDPAALNRVVPEPGPVPRWRAEPGVTLGELARVGLTQFTQAPPDTTLAAWYADRRAADWPPGRGDLSGIHAADILLADGVVETLGPFGAEDGAPLRSASLQALVPALFRLSSGPQAQWCRAQETWPAHYRLDALAPQAPATVNLGQVLQGHDGTLAWVEALVLQVPPGGWTRGLDRPPLRPAQARALDMRIKTLFDPGDLFPDIADRAELGTSG
jgi:hypothetical protein